MSKYTFNLPDIGEGIAEAEIVKWHIKIGDVVAEDDQLADVMTDKATVEMEAPVSGKIIAIAGEEGDIIAIGSMLVEIEVEGEVDADKLEELEASDAVAEASEEAESDVKNDKQDAEIKEEKSSSPTNPTAQAEVEQPADVPVASDNPATENAWQKVLATP
ncbi:branched-chain alpha-keto acid dehydrogenase subunit E2, partial [Sphingopyxis sp. BSNA05]|uniref:biotin/lipoyl-containing protein n=1 Tax=Sphingopyxis sp. BSNA05 TaxID=1236614 RepID=UPI001D9BBAE0